MGSLSALWRRAAAYLAEVEETLGRRPAERQAELLRLLLRNLEAGEG